MHFLCVDDEDGVLQILSIIFKIKSHQTSCISDPRQVMDWLARNPKPDGVILDLNMPYIYGTSLIPLIKNQHPDLPIVIFTGFDSAASRDACLKAGANKYLCKPIESSERFYSDLDDVFHMSGQSKDLTASPESASPSAEERKSTAGCSLRLCFLVAENDRDWELAGKRLQTRLQGRLQRDGIALINFEQRRLDHSLSFPDRRATETICLFYHASCELAAKIVQSPLPEFVCLMRVSGGTFEVEPPPMANATRHFHFTCANLDFASWFNWLERWHKISAFASHGFVLSCEALQKCSDVLLDTESLREHITGILPSIEVELADDHQDTPGLFSEPVRTSVEVCLAKIKRISDAITDAPEHERIALSGAFSLISSKLRELLQQQKRNLAQEILQGIQSALNQTHKSELEYREREVLHATFREKKHAIYNSFAVLAALAEISRRNPKYYSKLSAAVASRFPEVCEELQTITSLLLPCSTALNKSWGALETQFSESCQILETLASLSQREPDHYEELCAYTLEQLPHLMVGLSNWDEALRHELFDNRLADRANQVVK